MLAVALPAPDVPDSLSAPFHLTDRSVTVKSIVLLAYFLFVMCFQKSRPACRSEDARLECDKATRLPGITISFGDPAFLKMRRLIDGCEHRPHGGKKR